MHNVSIWQTYFAGTHLRPCWKKRQSIFQEILQCAHIVTNLRKSSRFHLKDSLVFSCFWLFLLNFTDFVTNKSCNNLDLLLDLLLNGELHSSNVIGWFQENPMWQEIWRSVEHQMVYPSYTIKTVNHGVGIIMVWRAFSWRGIRSLVRIPCINSTASTGKWNFHRL